MTTTRATLTAVAITIVAACGGRAGTGSANGAPGSAGTAPNEEGGGTASGNVGGTGAVAGRTATTASSTAGEASTIGGASATGGTAGATVSVGGESSECVRLWMDPPSATSVLNFVIDKDTSMNASSPSTGTQTKWEATRDALSVAFTEMSPELAVGAFFFPNEESGCVQPGVDAIPIAPLDAVQVQALQGGVMAIASPTSPPGSPTQDAWRQGLTDLEAMLFNPPSGYEGARGALVLITDQMPTRSLGCELTDGSDIAVTEEEFDQLIAEVADSATTTGIRTFVIAVPGSELTDQVPTVDGELDYLPRTKLSELAVAGQTAPPDCSTTGPAYCHIDLTDPTLNYAEELTNVVSDLASPPGSCEYVVPENTDPLLFVDPLMPFVVGYYAEGGTASTLVPEDVGCALGTGWDYTDASQTYFTLCPSLCSDVQAGLGIIEVSFGCLDVE